MSIDVEVDERPLREIYLAPFEAAVREAGVCMVMSAYNKLRGQFCSENRDLLVGRAQGGVGLRGRRGVRLVRDEQHRARQRRTGPRDARSGVLPRPRTWSTR